ncbi:hypothetical protein glysoja_026426 [Glycine soja]|uniref:Uncharacterized protein n=1 Tax=Glycine soja TaxID=3848 RepID=A0A0B2SU50_GLYSO|nr:hypothetical protein glysoja_026426 [Glycine soja]
MKMIGKRADTFLQNLIKENRSGKQPEYYSNHMIKGLIQAMLLAGTDT